MTLDQQTTIVNLFKKHTSDFKTAFKHFLDFQAREGSFGRDGIA
jgi:hypothetical protein